MKKKKESWPEQPGESVLHKHAHLHPILRVGYSSDSIQVWPRAECSTSTTNNKAFPFRPALQLTDLLLQLHHHAACDDRIRTITCGQLPLQTPTGPIWPYQRRHSCERGYWRSALRRQTPASADQWSLQEMPAASLWSPPGWSCGFWSFFSAAALEGYLHTLYICILFMAIR